MYEQSGKFSYTGAARKSPIYPKGRVEEGQPVYLRLEDEVPVRFDYRFRSKEPHGVAGEARLVAKLAGDALWERTVVLQPLTHFTGSRVTLRGTLDLPALRRLGLATQELTGTVSDSYALTIVPEVHALGVVAGQRIDETFAPSLAMRLDQVALRLDTTALEGDASLERSQPGEGERAASNRLSLLGFASLSVGTAREVARIGGGAAGVAAFLLGLLLLVLRLRGGGAEPARIRARYGSLLVEAAPRVRSREDVVELPTIEELVRLAHHYGAVVLHERHGDAHAYVVEEGGLAYRYAVGAIEAFEDDSAREVPPQPSGPAEEERRDDASSGARLRALPGAKRAAAL
jgi:hypothetical protein